VTSTTGSTPESARTTLPSQAKQHQHHQSSASTTTPPSIRNAVGSAASAR
jgi:hypothetical protein